MRRLETWLETELIDVARHLADAARTVTLRYFRTNALTAANKSTDGWDPVTDADRRCEQEMRKILRRRRPQDGIFGEEYNAVEGSSGLKWVRSN